MNGKWWLTTGLAALAFNRIEQSRFFAANVRSRATANLHIEGLAGFSNIPSKETSFACRLNGRVHAIGGQRIFASNIEKAAIASCSKGGNRHPFDDGKRITFHQYAIFECPGLGLVRV